MLLIIPSTVDVILYTNIPIPIAEEVILAEERTTEEEKMHIMDGKNTIDIFILKPNNNYALCFAARRRAAAKRKKLKNLGKSKSTDTEEEDAEDDCADDGKFIQ